MQPRLTALRLQLASAGDLAAAGWQWWRSEMESLFDDTVGSRLARGQSRARLSIQSETLTLQLRGSRDWSEAASLPRPPSPEALPDAIGELMRKAPSTLREIEIEAPSDRVLIRPIDLPAAVRPRLRAAVEYQLDRLTPFRPLDIGFDIVENKAAAREGRLSAHLAAIARKEIEAWIAAADPEGRCHCSVVSAASPQQPRFRFAQRRGRRARSPAVRIELALAASLGVLVIATLGVTAWHLSAEQRLIDARLDALRSQAKQAEETRASLEQRLRQAAFLGTQLSSVDAAQILSAVTRDLPVDSWVFQFQQDGTSLTLSGFAKNATLIASALEKDPLFAQAQLRSAMQQPGSSNERFEIQLTLKTGAVSGAAK